MYDEADRVLYCYCSIFVLTHVIYKRSGVINAIS